MTFTIHFFLKYLCVMCFWFLKASGNKRKTETFLFFLFLREKPNVWRRRLYPNMIYFILKKFCGRNSPNSSCKTPPVTSQKRFPTSKLKARTERRLETVFSFSALRGASNWPQGRISLLLFSLRDHFFDFVESFNINK